MSLFIKNIEQIKNCIDAILKPVKKKEKYLLQYPYLLFFLSPYLFIFLSLYVYIYIYKQIFYYLKYLYK